MLLETAHQKLGWPSRSAILSPSGSGPAAYARQVQAKLGRALARRDDASDVKVGILSADPAGDATEPPIAVVCEFQRIASDASIEEAHRLAWNFCRSPLLITLEPQLIRAWTSCEPPRRQPNGQLPDSRITSLHLTSDAAVDFSSEATRALSWVSLVSGRLFRDHAPRFVREHCADESLLSNLRVIRNLLLKQKKPLSVDTAHDLLARLIFVQFLFHRKDEQGRAALTSEWLLRQYDERQFESPHETLESVLRSHSDTYALFQLLNDRFNGDLFPGKSEKIQERKIEWRREMAEVTPDHLNMLADFVGGKTAIGHGQHSLWPLYSFDVIPLEFISSVYETFVSRNKGTHYTPAHLVDMVLDTCLPWNSDDWDVTVLDPACGSGIFLVKAFQRLVYRWRRANGFSANPGAELLRKLLTENLFGIDIQREAVRVACFSLYLAMCDEIEPRHVWERVRFPRLRGQRLIDSDFFNDDAAGFRTLPDQGTYAIVVGNAPWGTGTMTESARRWANGWNWSSFYKNIGPLFLAKAARLCKQGGRVAMLQPSGLLFNSVATAVTFRKRLFEKYDVDQIINLSALRFGLFKNAVAPACIVSLQASPPSGEPISYVSPKPFIGPDDDFRIVFDAYDYHSVLLHEAIDDSTIWTSLMWGSRRDRSLLRRLSAYPTIEKLELAKKVRTRTGIIRGSNPTKRRDEILDRPLFDQNDFPADGFPYLSPGILPRNDNPFIDRRDSIDWSAFEPAQLLIKLGWKRGTRRFQSRVVDGSEGVLCSTSYVSVHFPSDQISAMASACITYNSKLAAYFLLLTSNRFASFIQEVNANDLLRVPLPRTDVTLEGVSSAPETDEIVRRAFGIKAAEWVLIEDAFRYTLSAFQAADPTKSRAAVTGKESRVEQIAGPALVDSDMLEEYGEAFAKVIRAGFGSDKRVRITVFRTPVETSAPVHFVAIHLGWPGEIGVHYEDITTESLLTRIVELSRALEQRSNDGMSLYRRVARVYDTVTVGRQKVPTVYLCKPNVPRYWTRSMGMRDADEVSADFVTLANVRQQSKGAVSA
jgi:hypothetical protein